MAGGEAPKFGNILPKEDGEQKVLMKCKSFGWDRQKTELEIRKHAAFQSKARRRGYNPFNKALGGPREHEEFEAWDDDNPIVKLFHRGNVLHIGYDIWAYSTLFWLLTGELYWWVMRNEYGVPVEIWVIPTHWMRLVTGRDGLPEAYAIQSPWGTLQYAPYDDVLPFYDHSPLSYYEGWGVTLMIAEWIDAYETMLRSRLAQNLNGGIPAFHVALSDEYVDPDEAMLNRYYSKWFSRFQGPENAGKPLITGPGVEVKALSISPVDMDYVATENQFRDMILSALGVPKGVVGLEPPSDTSAYAPQRAFLRFAVQPWLGMLSQRITHGLIRRTPNCDRGVCYWDDRVLDDPEQVSRERQGMFDRGMLTPNEGRTAEGYEPFPHGGDDPVLNQQIVPWGTGQQSQDNQDLEQSMDRAKRGQIELNPRADQKDTHPARAEDQFHQGEDAFDQADEQEPLIIDKDEEAPISADPLLRWHRTKDGHFEAAGNSGRWYLERTKQGYKLHRDGTQFDESRAVGLLKELAEKEEQKVAPQSIAAKSLRDLEEHPDFDQYDRMISNMLRERPRGIGELRSKLSNTQLVDAVVSGLLRHGMADDIDDGKGGTLYRLRKALGEGSGSSGGYLVGSQHAERIPAKPRKGIVSSPPSAPFVEPKEGVTMDDREKHNEEVSYLLKRLNCILGSNSGAGSNMVLGNGKH